MVATQLRIKDFSSADDVLAPEFLPTAEAGARSLFDIQDNIAQDLVREQFFCANTCDVVAHC
jgi:hypothetical protein